MPAVLDEIDTMNKDHKETPAASFWVDPGTMTEPCLEHTFHRWSLPADIAAFLQSPDRRHETSIFLISALRILHYRHSVAENSSLAVINDGEPSLTHFFDINVDENTSIGQVVEASRAMMAILEHTESSSANASYDHLCFHYLGAGEEKVLDDSPKHFAMVWRFCDTATCRIDYDETRYRTATVESLAVNFTDVLSAVLSDSHLLVTEIKFHHALGQLEHLKGPLLPPSNPALCENLVEAFEDVVARYGSTIALIQGTLASTYHELDILSSLLADEILAQRSLDHQSDDFIAFCMPPSALTIITILAIIKTGCAYVPIDFRQAPDRVLDILRSARNPCVVVSVESPQFIRDVKFKAPTIDITGFLNDWKSRTYAEEPKKPQVAKRSGVACLLFTSGTTGTPKGVRVLHKNILSLASNQDAIPFQPGSFVAQMANLAWDAHILEVWCSLLSGATIFSFNRFDILDPIVLTGQFRGFGITACFLSTTMFRHILNKSPQLLKSLKVLFTGGEKGRFEDFAKAKDVNPDLTVIHVYGPTECCVFVTCHAIKLSIDFPETGTPPIGPAISTAQLAILDPRGSLVPPGIIGEIFIRGVGVADGYEGQEKETRASFIERQIPGVNESPCTFYRTGDQGRWNSDGHIEFIGRIDPDQIKIRGQRFEVTDVEANIVRMTKMQDVGVAYYRSDNQSDGSLLGYVVPGPASEYWKSLEENETMLVKKWEEYYDDSYTSDDIVKIRKEFIGWDSMISGQPIPPHEMQDWLDDTLRPFFRYRPEKVFEIGCGIGIILYQMMPFVEHFYGMEPSGAGVQQVKEQLHREGLAEKATLWHASAHEIPNLPEFDVDFVLINSVTQYCPSIKYLETVILKSLGRCRPGGHIVLGDVRSAPLDDLLAIDVFMEQWKPSLAEKTVQDLREQVSQRQNYTTELLVNPTFFFDLQRRDSRITHVEIVPKSFSHNNELSRYRYQAILHVREQISLFEPDVWMSPDARSPYMAHLPQLLKEFVSSNELYLAIEKIPNRFLAWERKILETASATSTPELASLATLLPVDMEGQGWSASDLIEYAKTHGVNVQISFARQAEGGILDAVFIKSQDPNQTAVFPLPRTSSSYLQLNKDKESTYKRKLLTERSWKDIADTLKTKLPAYMIPEALYVVEQLPFTLNGKIDRKVLAKMAASDHKLKLQKGSSVHGYQSDTERIICNLFSDSLGCGSSISPSTDFFAQGGHSLLATRLRSALQEKFQVVLPMREIFDSPTPKQLAVKVTELQKTTAPTALHVDRTADAGNISDLSFAQFRPWFLSELNPKDIWYHAGFALRFQERLDEEVLDKTIIEIVSRHDILRTIFIEQDGVPKSRVVDTMPIVEKVDIDTAVETETMKSIVLDYITRPFNWSHQPPFRPILFRWGSQHILLVSLHHIITDGFSRDIWRNELKIIYPTLLAGGHLQLPALPIQYQDYARWQRSREHEQLIKPQLEYWIPYLEGSQPARFPRDSKPTSLRHGGTSVLTCDYKLKEKLDTICKQNRLTWFMLLIAAFRAVHFEWTGQLDASLGNPIANRHRLELENLLGFFVNTQVFRLKCHQGMSFRDLLRQTRELALKAFENQDVPFDKLVEIMRPRRSSSQNPLIEIMFAFQTAKTDPFTLSGIPVKMFPIDTQTSRFDLEVHWSERSDQLRCVFFYRKDVFKSSTIDKLGQKVLGFLETIAENLDVAISSDGSKTLEFENIPGVSDPDIFDPESGPDGPPQNDIERKICEVFERTLGQTPITRQSDFFHSGGHSLLVTLACSKLSVVFQRKVKVRDVFESPTPASLSKRIQTLLSEEDIPEAIDLVTTQGIQSSQTEIPTHFVFKSLPKKPRLFCVPMVTGMGTLFRSLATESKNFNVVALNDPFLCEEVFIAEKNPSQFGLTELAEIYYREIVRLDGDVAEKSSQHITDTQGPLNILGYSFGGNVAIEVARFALHDGYKVNLFLMDSADGSLPLELEFGQDNRYGIRTEELDKITEAAIDVASKTMLDKTNMSLNAASQNFSDFSNLRGIDIIARARSCVVMNVRRLMRHRLVAYPGPVVMFRSEANAMHGLHQKVKSLDEVVLEGSHYHLLDHSSDQLKLIINKISSIVDS